MFTNPSAPLDMSAHARSRSLSLARSPTALTSSPFFLHAASRAPHEAHELGAVPPPLRRTSQLYKVVEWPEDDVQYKGRSRDRSRDSDRGEVGVEWRDEGDSELEMLMMGGEDEYDGPFQKPDRRELLWMAVSALVVLSLAGMAFLTTIYNWVL